MPQSMEMTQIRQMVKDSGYSQLVWALRLFLEQGQYQLAAMIVISFCLAPRNTPIADNGVLSVLRSHKLQRWMWDNKEFTSILNSMVRNNDHADKIAATLVGANWWNHSDFHPRGQTDPAVFKDDDIMYFVPLHMQEQGLHQLAFCDLAGAQWDRYFPYFRMTRVDEYTVRIISRQMDRDHYTSKVAQSLGNGYSYVDIPASTIVHRSYKDHVGKTLGDILKVGEWCNYNFEPDTALDLVDRDYAAR